MAKIYQRSGTWHARFQYRGEDYRRSTGVTVVKGKGSAEAKAKAQAELERMMAEVRGGESAELLFLRLNEAIGQMPRNEQERKRIAFAAVFSGIGHSDMAQRANETRRTVQSSFGYG